MAAPAATQYFSLRWNNHPVNLVSVFTGLYQAESLVDVSLAAEGKHLQAHKVVLSACSDYFQALFAANPCQHPIVILKDVAFEDLQTVVKFMYHGIVNVSSDKLPAVLKTADALQIKGLEKNNELMAPYLASSSRGLLSVPGQVRQPSTDSLPDFLQQSAMQRSRSDGGFFPQRAHSAESRGLSFDSHPLELGRPKRLLSPTGSLAPTRSNTIEHSGSYARKKFRNRSENTLSLSVETSVDMEGREGEKDDRKSPYPASIDVPGQEEHIAKKKRAMFQARSKSSGSGKSTDLQNSIDGRPEGKGVTVLESMSSSSLSIQQSFEKEESPGGCDTLQVPSMAQSRTMVRAASVSAAESPHHSALTTKFKRGRFLQRQQCQEGEEREDSAGGQASVTKSEPPSSPPPSTATLVKQHSSPVLPYSSPSRSSPPPPKEEPPSPPRGPPRDPSLDPLCGLESVPLLYSSSGPRPHPIPPASLFRPSLPAVRITTEQEPGHSLLPVLHSPPPVQSLQPPAQSHQLSPCHSPGLLYPGIQPYDQVSPPLHHPRPEDRKSPGSLQGGHPGGREGGHLPGREAGHLGGRDGIHLGGREGGHHGGREGGHLGAGLLNPGLQGQGKNRMEGLHTLNNHHGGGGYPNYHGPGGPSPLQLGSVGGARQLPHSGAVATMEQFGHCPKAREGPALSCNFCWNTTDGSGRILRRKTKYHCPECQTNLCIVPCFQQYHEAMESENSMVHH